MVADGLWVTETLLPAHRASFPIVGRSAAYGNSHSEDENHEAGKTPEPVRSWTGSAPELRVHSDARSICLFVRQPVAGTNDGGQRPRATRPPDHNPLTGPVARPGYRGPVSGGADPAAIRWLALRNLTELPFLEQNDSIQALTPNRTDEAFAPA